MSEKDLFKKVQEAKQAIQKISKLTPRVGLIMGTGLGAGQKKIEVEATIDYKKIPHFPHSTVKSHKGRLVLGKFAGLPVVVMEGRFHYYEGYSMEQVSFPVRVMKALGIRELIITNASGGLNPMFKKGDMMAIADHINFMGDNPLIGPHDDRFGDRFPDMIEPYSARLIKTAEEVALKEGLSIQKGTYIGVAGPCLETRAEYRMMRAWGADAVGMSTVPEVIVAAQLKLAVLAISVITDLCLPDALHPVKIEEIIATANKTEPKLARLLNGVLDRIRTSRV